jgi:trehalose 6-phosphate synthase
MIERRRRLLTVSRRFDHCDAQAPNGLSAVMVTIQDWAQRNGWQHESLGIAGHDVRTDDREVGWMNVERVAPGLFDRYYLDVCCERIWPALHGQHSELRARDWAPMAEVSRLVAKRIASSGLSDADQLWLHDFHVLPVAAALRKLGWRRPIGYFQHVPLALVTDSDLQRRLERWLQIPDVVAVQSQSDADAARALGVAGECIVVAPVPAVVSSHHPSPDGDIFGARRITLAGRVDPTKGHVIGMRAVARAAAVLGIATHVRIHAPPSRIRSEAYEKTLSEIRATATLVERALADLGGALELTEDPLPRRAMDELLAATDLLLIPSLADGMNLIAKEYVLLRGEQAHRLVLTPSVGARYSLPGAWVSRDASERAIADALVVALEASEREVEIRAGANTSALGAETPDDWMRSLTTALRNAYLDPDTPPEEVQP